MDKKTIYREISYTGCELSDKIDRVIDETKDKYKDYRLIKLISILFPETIVESKMEYDYPLSSIEAFNFYNNFRDYVYPNQKFVAKVGFVFEK